MEGEALESAVEQKHYTSAIPHTVTQHTEISYYILNKSILQYPSTQNTDA